MYGASHTVLQHLVGYVVFYEICSTLGGVSGTLPDMFNTWGCTWCFTRYAASHHTDSVHHQPYCVLQNACFFM